jgi:hypothetical protein
MEDREAMGSRLEGRTSHRRWKSMPWLVLMCCVARWCDAQASPPIRQPLAVSANFRYFKDSIGAPLVLTGSQTWNTLQGGLEHDGLLPCAYSGPGRGIPGLRALGRHIRGGSFGHAGITDAEFGMAESGHGRTGGSGYDPGRRARALVYSAVQRARGSVPGGR